MHMERWILAVIAPPLSVIDQGLNTIILVTFFTLLGWVPGVIVALGITYNTLYWARRNIEREHAAEMMRQSVMRRETLVNLPASHRSGDERFKVAVRGQQMIERYERKRGKIR